jgi:hypothetical protein
MHSELDKSAGLSYDEQTEWAKLKEEMNITEYGLEDMRNPDKIRESNLPDRGFVENTGG